jgi:predicted Zn finger-like uncharacterized protein
MTDAKQTKCPHCGSTFRISESQLAAKGGSVRCGSCLQVFRADLYLLGAATASAHPASAAPQQAAPKPKNKKDAGSDESWALALLDEKNEPSSSPSSTPSGTPSSKATASNHGSHDDEWHIAGEATEAGGDDGFSFNDDDISTFITTDAADHNIPSGKSIRFDDEINEMLDEAADSHLHADEAAHGSHRLNENADESWAQSILSELEDDDKKSDSKKYSMEILDGKTKAPPKNARMAEALGLGSGIAAEPATRKSDKVATAAAKPRPSDDFLAEDADVLSFLDDEDFSSTAAPPPLSTNPFSLDRPLAHVDAPLMLKPRREPIHWGPLLTWTFLCLIALVMFAAQYTYFNFESLAIQPTVRPYFEQACVQFGCRLPDIPDPSKLKVDELVVRKHPKIEGVLMVDAILKNNAGFVQPFPALRLSFSNTTDEIVASRILKPSDYLEGEAKLMRRMPPDTPIRISLEIVDPGKNAVSYSLTPVH